MRAEPGSSPSSIVSGRDQDVVNAILAQRTLAHSHLLVTRKQQQHDAHKSVHEERIRRTPYTRHRARRGESRHHAETFQPAPPKELSLEVSSARAVALCIHVTLVQGLARSDRAGS
eukprot:2892094-Rhodomonas_salina.1